MTQEHEEPSGASGGSVAELVETIAAFMDQTDRFKGGAIPVVTPEATKARIAFFWLRKILGVTAQKTALTEAEREAVGQVIDAANGMGQAEPWTTRALRRLLERTK